VYIITDDSDSDVSADVVVVEPVSTEGFVLSVEGYLLFFLFKIKTN